MLRAIAGTAIGALVAGAVAGGLWTAHILNPPEPPSVVFNAEGQIVEYNLEPIAPTTSANRFDRMVGFDSQVVIGGEKYEAETVVDWGISTEDAIDYYNTYMAGNKSDQYKGLFEIEYAVLMDARTRLHEAIRAGDIDPVQYEVTGEPVIAYNQEIVDQYQAQLAERAAKRAAYEAACGGDQGCPPPPPGNAPGESSGSTLIFYFDCATYNLTAVNADEFLEAVDKFLEGSGFTFTLVSTRGSLTGYTEVPCSAGMESNSPGTQPDGNIQQDSDGYVAPPW